ncbi:Fic family protein [Cellvibrio sp. pealriver]|uniref:Fic family protein n=1 Tax=Cellvibrio sp. pealriver TaxID=1622269 RepID=UPI00066FF128|nr:Fic family protein [Cellvibrio sp. pealriver]
MATSILDIAPFIPSDKSLGQSLLPDKAISLISQSAKLTGQIAPLTLARLEQHMAAINSYYSNLIEGNATRPHEIRAAQRGNYSGDPAKRDLQQESLAHMQVQEWLVAQQPDLDRLFTPDFICRLHREFYQRVPESLWVIKDEQGETVDKVIPGEWRARSVIVGQHIPPKAEDLALLMAKFCETYNPKKFSGDRKIIALMAAHHRFAWIHPFIDGNGRVGRLLTDAALKAVGLESYGAWCLSRGLARSATQYKNLLANADAPRQGDHDGRGHFTEKGLINFCDYMLDNAIDQVTYISDLLELAKMRQRIESYVAARNDDRVDGISGQLKSTASLILFTAFQQGEIQRAQALELCAMPERSARRLLSQLKSEGLLSETSSKSPLRWEIPEHAEPWYFPNLNP